MYLTPTEADRLQLFQAAELARRVRSRGNKLSAPEATALLCDEMHLAARDGASYEEVVAVGKTTLRADDLLDGVGQLLEEIRLEVSLAQGTRLIVLRRPWDG